MLKPLFHEAPEIKGSLVVDHDRRREQQPQPRLLQLGMDGWLPEPVSPDVPAPVEIYPLIGGVVARNLRSEGLCEGEHVLAVPAEVNGPVNDASGLAVLDGAANGSHPTLVASQHLRDPVLSGNAVGGRDRDDVARALTHASLPELWDERGGGRLDELHVWEPFSDDLGRAVGGVIDDHDLHSGPRLLGDQRRQALLDARACVMGRHHYRHLRPVRRYDAGLRSQTVSPVCADSYPANTTRSSSRACRARSFEAVPPLIASISPCR